MANILSKLGARATAQVNEIMKRSYTTVVSEYIPRGFRSQIFVLRVTGLWVTADDAPYYKWFTAAFFAFGIALLLLMFINVFFVDSIERLMDNLFLVFSMLLIVIKAGALYLRRDSISRIFSIHATLLGNCSRDHAAQHNRIARINLYLHAMITTLYSSIICAMGIQVIYLMPADRFFMSTFYLPYDWAQSGTVYWAVMVYQIVCGMIVAVTVASLDTIFFALINTTCGHVRQLKQRLQHLGTSGDNAKFYKDLIDCCKCYGECVRFEIRIGATDIRHHYNCVSILY